MDRFEVLIKELSSTSLLHLDETEVSGKGLIAPFWFFLSDYCKQVSASRFNVMRSSLLSRNPYLSLIFSHLLRQRPAIHAALVGEKNLTLVSTRVIYSA